MNNNNNNNRKNSRNKLTLQTKQTKNVLIHKKIIHSYFTPAALRMCSGMLHAMYSTNSKQLLDEAEYHLKNYTDHGEISIILYMIRKANSMIVLLFILNNSLFKNKLKHTHLHRC